MSDLIKLACPACECVTFEPQWHLDSVGPNYSCIPCGHTAPIAAWKVAGITSKRQPNVWVRLAAATARSRLVAEALAARASAIARSYVGGINY